MEEADVPPFFICINYITPSRKCMKNGFPSRANRPCVACISESIGV